MVKQSLYYNLVMSQTNSIEEETVDNGDTSDSSLVGGAESEEELGNFSPSKRRFETVIEEDNFEDKKSEDPPIHVDQSAFQEQGQL